MFEPDKQIFSDLVMDDSIQTMIKICEKIQQIFKLFLEGQQSNFAIMHLSKFSDIYQKAICQLFEKPNSFWGLHLDYWCDFMLICQEAAMHWLGNESSSESEIKQTDKRFLHNEWIDHPLFCFIKNSYSLTASYIQKTINNLEGLDARTAKQINFYTRQFIDAISPSNFVITNPEILQLTFKTKGNNLLQGLENLHEDLKRNKGQFNIKMTDLNAFEVGKNVATTPGRVVYQNDIIQLIRYEPKTEKVYRRPLLIIPPWINKYYILDLSENNSFVKWIVEQGYTVFIISWVNPDKRHSSKDFEDYLIEGSIAALDAITRETGETHINALGYCGGGTLLACTLAYLAAKKDDRIVSATYLCTLLDYSDPGDIVALIDEEHIQELEQQMLQEGYLDGRTMAMAFNMLRANELIWAFYIKNYLKGEEPFPFDFLYWNSDVTNMPAKMHSFYLRNMYLQNRLIKPKGIKLKNTTIDLKKIKTPVYFLSTIQDHIAPWKSTYAGVNLHAGPVTFVLGGSGHVAGIVNPPNNNKYCYYINQDLTSNADQWLKNATSFPGSWWPHWEKWLKNFSGKKIIARGSHEKVPALEHAPGSYVRVRV